MIDAVSVRDVFCIIACDYSITKVVLTHRQTNTRKKLYIFSASEITGRGSGEWLLHTAKVDWPCR